MSSICAQCKQPWHGGNRCPRLFCEHGAQGHLCRKCPHLFCEHGIQRYRCQKCLVDKKRQHEETDTSKTETKQAKLEEDTSPSQSLSSQSQESIHSSQAAQRIEEGPLFPPTPEGPPPIPYTPSASLESDQNTQEIPATSLAPTNGGVKPNQPSLADLRAQVPIHAVMDILNIQIENGQIKPYIVKFDMAQFKKKRITARTLYAHDVDEHSHEGERRGEHQCTHENGWTIRGEVEIDHFRWVNYFEAHHPLHGWVAGNFETTVYASSQQAYNLFIEQHHVNEWDYWDI